MTTIKPIKRSTKYPDNIVVNGKLIAAGKATVQQTRVRFKIDPKTSNRAMLDGNDKITLQVAGTNESIPLTRTKNDRQSSADGTWFFSKVSVYVIPYGEDSGVRST